MPFSLSPSQKIEISGKEYSFAEHPHAPGMAFGQEGRQATVFKLIGEKASKALKVFKSRFRTPGMVSHARKIEEYAKLPGMKVCKREVLSAREDIDLLRVHAELTYAAMMPWVEGKTWQEILLDKEKLTPSQSLEIAKALADVLASLKENALAHCDLSGANIILSSLSKKPQVELVDVEGMYASNLRQPKIIAAGSPGYAHKTAPEAVWSAEADRFAGALLLAEILGFSDEMVVASSWGENYFNPRLVQEEHDNFELIASSLEAGWGEEIAHLFRQAWNSDIQGECPTFGEWLVALPVIVPKNVNIAKREGSKVFAGPSKDEIVRPREGLVDQTKKSVDSPAFNITQEIYQEASRDRETSKSRSVSKLWLLIVAVLIIVFLVFTNTDDNQESPTIESQEPISTRISQEPTLTGFSQLSATEVIRDDDIVRIWDSDKVVELAVLEGPTGFVVSVAWSPDGERLASASGRGTVRIWDANSGIELAVLKGHTQGGRSVAWSPDGERLASGSWDDTVRIWDADSGEELAVLEGHIYGTRSVAWSPDGERLASAGGDRTVRIWDADSGVELAVLRAHTRSVLFVAWSPDGKRLVSGSWDVTVRIWDVDSGVELDVLEGNRSFVWGVAWSPDGERVASGGDDGTVRIWDADSGVELAVLERHISHSGVVRSIAWSPDGVHLASGNADGTVLIWNADSGVELAVLEGHTKSVRSVAWSPDGERLASGSHDETVRIWGIP